MALPFLLLLLAERQLADLQTDPRQHFDVIGDLLVRLQEALHFREDRVNVLLSGAEVLPAEGLRTGRVLVALVGNDGVMIAVHCRFDVVIALLLELRDWQQLDFAEEVLATSGELDNETEDVDEAGVPFRHFHDFLGHLEMQVLLIEVQLLDVDVRVEAIVAFDVHVMQVRRPH